MPLFQTLQRRLGGIDVSTPLHSSSRPATGDMTQIVRVPAYAAEIAWYANGVLFVASDYENTAKIYAFEADLRRQGLLIRKEAVSLGQIKQMRDASRQVERIGVRSDNTAMDRMRDLMARAVKMSASDIHFNIYEESHCLIRYRVDGYLRDIMEVLPQDAITIITAFYNACEDKNVGEWRKNEICMGRMIKKEQLIKGLFAVRFASNPTSAGALIVLRLLYDYVASRAVKAEDITLDTLGFDAEQVNAIKAMASSPNGANLISGPTGAGKSSTLKYNMQWIHQTYPHFNILTVEDPPEYPIVGAQQIPVLVQDNDDADANERARKYAKVIATTLRLDPDILMVGEIRDGSSAVAALRAAETGHRLWSTIHANDGWEILNRMLDLLREGGMSDPLPVLCNTQNLSGIMAQRLVPKLCPNCRLPLFGHEERIGGIEGTTYQELLQAVDDFPVRSLDIFVRGDGCPTCVPDMRTDEERKADKGAGILGRTLVAETIRPDQRLLDVVRRHGIPAARRRWLENGGRTMTDHAIAKMLAGVIAPDAVREFVGPIQSSAQLLLEMGEEDD